MSNRTYKHGDHLVQCDYSGFVCHASETRMTWDGWRVLKRFWEPRHPQDFVRVTPDNPSVGPEARPRKTADYETVTVDDL